MAHSSEFESAPYYLRVYLAPDPPLIHHGKVVYPKVHWYDPHLGSGRPFPFFYPCGTNLWWDPDRIISPPWMPNKGGRFVEGLIPIVRAASIAERPRVESVPLRNFVWVQILLGSGFKGLLRAAPQDIGRWNGCEFETASPVGLNGRWVWREWAGWAEKENGAALRWPTEKNFKAECSFLDVNEMEL